MSSMVLKETLLVQLLSVVLKEGGLLTWCSVSWKETFFPARLTWGLERSLSASIFDHIFDSVGIVLFSNDAYAIYTRGLERSQLVSVFLSFAFMCSAGVLKGVSVHVSLMTYAVYTKGLEISWLVLLPPALCMFGWDLERSLGACACSHGLERTGWMVLKGLWCNSLVPLWCFAIYFKQRSWKESLELIFVLFSIAETDLETFLHKTWTKSNLEQAACQTMISLHVLVSTT